MRSALELLLIGAIIGPMTANRLPVDVLIEIFDCFLFRSQVRSQEEILEYARDVNAWRTLALVCRRWRTIVFDVPRRLNLRLFFTNGTPVSETLALFQRPVPQLPMVIWQTGYEMRGLDSIIEALRRNDRVCEISLLDVPIPRLLEVMRQPFNVLTNLSLRWQDEAGPVVPYSFLGGSAQSLRILEFCHVPFPGIPRLLLSATNLVELHLLEIPDSGYFTPEAFVHCLSALSRLKLLSLEFESPLPPLQVLQNIPPIRSSLPVLTSFKFNGDAMYLENLVAPIAAPLVEDLEITFFHGFGAIFNTDTPRFVDFVSRTCTPNVRLPVEAHVDFSNESVSVRLPGAFRGSPQAMLRLEVLCAPTPTTFLISSLAQVCKSSLPHLLLRAVEHLYIRDTGAVTEAPRPDGEEDDIGVEGGLWLEVLRRLPAVKDLYLTRGSVPLIAPALQGPIEEGGTEVLPALKNLFLEELPLSESVQEAIGQFVAARQLADRPIAVSHWDGKIGIKANDLPVVGDSSVLDGSR